MSAWASSACLRRGVGEQLHLVELVHAEQPAGVAPGRARLAPVARRRRGVAQGELGLLQDLAPVHGGQRHLGRRDQPQVVPLDVVGVVGELGQVAGRRHGLGQDDGRRADLLVGRRVPVDGERGQRPQQARPRPAVEGEHGAGEARAALHVEDLQRLPDLPVRDLLVLQPSGFRPPEVLAGPPPADLHVVVLAGPVRRVLGRDVGEVEQSGPDLLAQHVGLRPPRRAPPRRAGGSAR